MPEIEMLTYIHFKGEMAPRVLANLVSIHPNPCGIMRASNAKIDVLFGEIRRVRVGKGMVVPAFIVFSFYYWSGLTVYTSMS